jgi:hypothetical protein
VGGLGGSEALSSLIADVPPQLNKLVTVTVPWRSEARYTENMTTSRRVGWWAGRKMARRLEKSIPLVGTVISIAYLAHSIRRKGVFGGLAHTALDVLPVVGTVKNGIEMFTDDWFPDRPAPATVPSSPSSEEPRPRSRPGRRIRGA